MTRAPVCVTVTAVVTIGALELYALHQGINGTVFALVIAALAGIAGFNVSELRKRKGG